MKHTNYNAENPKLFIDLEEVIKHGSINMLTKGSPIGLGVALLPPAQRIEQYAVGDLDICYGDVTLAFRENRLSSVSILLDEDVNTNPYVDFDYWELEDYARLCVPFVAEVLSDEGIDYEVKHFFEDETIDIFIPSSGVTLSFWLIDNADYSRYDDCDCPDFDCNCHDYISEDIDYFLSYITIG